MRLGIRISPKYLIKAHRDISKLTPKIVTDKNGHARKVYVKLGLPIKKDGRVDNLDSYRQSVRKITQRVHEQIEGGKNRPQEPLEKIKIGKVEPWIVQNAKEVGLDIEGFDHEVSNYFIQHVIKNHGEEKTEVSRGNLPVTDEDIERIPAIIEKPDYAIFGAKRNEGDRIIYVKLLDNGTVLYFEEILTGNKNKSLRGNTMYKTGKVLNEDELVANIGMNGKTDLSNIKIADMGGSHPTNTANQG
jgi:hypothetical protein